MTARLTRVNARRARLALVALAGFAALSCGASAKKDDPLQADPFFGGDSAGSRSANEVLNRRAPSVGWLADPNTPRTGGGTGSTWETGAPYRREPLEEDAEADMLARERAALGGVDPDEPPAGPGGDAGESPGGGDEKSFSERAQEATLSTLSILLGVGMTALPYLLGT